MINRDNDGIPSYLDPEEETEIVVMQMVTPNGDGKNEFLWIENVDKALNNKLQIFNRWGIAVYDGEDYNNQNNVFDGRSKGKTYYSWARLFTCRRVLLYL
ncbi:T9SS type B sorting domain-containing protein [Zobellia nedashkovskayae]